jgi:hypothetical protein
MKIYTINKNNEIEAFELPEAPKLLLKPPFFTRNNITIFAPSFRLYVTNRLDVTVDPVIITLPNSCQITCCNRIFIYDTIKLIVRQFTQNNVTGKILKPKSRKLITTVITDETSMETSENFYIINNKAYSKSKYEIIDDYPINTSYYKVVKLGSSGRVRVETKTGPTFNMTSQEAVDALFSYFAVFIELIKLVS